MLFTATMCIHWMQPATISRQCCFLWVGSMEPLNWFNVKDKSDMTTVYHWTFFKQKLRIHVFKSCDDVRFMCCYINALTNLSSHGPMATGLDDSLPIRTVVQLLWLQINKIPRPTSEGMIHQHLIFVLLIMSRFHLVIWWIIPIENGLHKRWHKTAKANQTVSESWITEYPYTVDWTNFE